MCCPRALTTCPFHNFRPRAELSGQNWRGQNWAEGSHMSDATDARPTRLRKKTAKATEAEEAIAGGDATPPADPDVLIHSHRPRQLLGSARRRELRSTDHCALEYANGMLPTQMRT